MARVGSVRSSISLAPSQQQQGSNSKLSLNNGINGNNTTATSPATVVRLESVSDDSLNEDDEDTNEEKNGGTRNAANNALLPPRSARNSVSVAAPSADNISLGGDTSSSAVAPLIPGVAPSRVLVCVRVRPVTNSERSKGNAESCLKLPSATRLAEKISIVQPETQKPRDYFFDAIFEPSDGQEALYNKVVRQLVATGLEGYNVCIFCYGQTGSGKTYTIAGTPQDLGLIQRVGNQIVQFMNANEKQTDFVVRASYLEIYQEQLSDLLVDKKDITGDANDLKIRQEPDGTGLFVQGITEKTIATTEDINRILTRGAKNRVVGETNMNEFSSRSHAVLTIKIEQFKRGERNNESSKKTSKIHLIDLAGSERADATGATGVRLKEGSSINQSLSCLGNVINALTKKGGVTHVPYRDSKLTYLLSDSLGGNSLTLMIACLSPAARNYDETLSTLRFADRAKHIRNNARINMDPQALRIQQLEAEVAQLKRLLAACTCGKAILPVDLSSPEPAIPFWKKLLMKIKKLFEMKLIIRPIRVAPADTTDEKDAKEPESPSKTDKNGATKTSNIDKDKASSSNAAKEPKIRASAVVDKK